MAYTSVTSQSVASATGLAPVLTAPGATQGDVLDCDGAAGRTFLYVLNGSGSPITVTINATATQDGLAVASRVYTVAAGATSILPIGPSRTFGQGAGSFTGRAKVDYSSVTTVTRAAILIPTSY